MTGGRQRLLSWALHESNEDTLAFANSPDFENSVRSARARPRDRRARIERTRERDAAERVREEPLWRGSWVGAARSRWAAQSVGP